MSRSLKYRSIMKGTALFGGVQLFNAIVGVLRGKLVAIFLGTVGMGISSLYMSTLMPLQQIFSIGMPMAIVSVIAAASVASATEKAQMHAQVEAYRRSLGLLSLVGVMTMLVFAPLFSMTSFGDIHHWRAYVGLSIGLFFMIMDSAETSVLQARHHMKSVAVRSVVNALAGLLIGVPLYVLWGVRGIVPAIVVSAAVVWAFARWQTHRHGFLRIQQRWADTWRLSRGIMMLGFFMMLAGLLGNITTYVVNAFISRVGGVEDVGLYQAATSITSQYVGLVFAAMATDYYPRLSALAGDRRAAGVLVRRQLEVVLLIVAPLVALLVASAPWLIRVLLTEEFMPLTGIVRLMGLALVCRAACFSMDYVSIASGHKRYFFWMEGVWCNVKTLVVTLVAYYYWGLEGLGWAALLSGVIDVVVTTVMTRWYFGITTWPILLRMFLPLVAALSLCTWLSFQAEPALSLGGTIACTAVLSAISLVLLRRRAKM